MTIDYLIFDAIRVGFERVIIVIRRDIEENFKRAVSNHANVSGCGKAQVSIAEGCSAVTLL